MRVLLLLAVLALPFSACPDTIVLGPVNVIDMSTGEVGAGRAVIVEDGLIGGVIAFADAPADAQGIVRVDGGEGWLIPGLAEMHAHVPSSIRSEQHTRDILTLFLANGVTTVRGMLGEPWHLELRALLDRQEWPGPRLITSGPSFNGRTVSSPEQAAKRVREQAAAGYDFLKIHPGLNPDEFAALATAAKQVGIPFAGHVSFTVGLDAALRAKQSTIDHLDAYAEAMVPDDSDLVGLAPRWFGLNLALAMDPSRARGLAMATASAGVWVVPTQSLFETTAGIMPVEDLLERPGMQYLSPGLLDNWKRRMNEFREDSSEAQRLAFNAARRALIRELQNAGAGLLLGSDAPQIMNVPGFSVHQELQYLVAAGLTPLQALQSGTINVARFFGHRFEGEIKARHAADFILLKDNPLLDIGATQGIEGVMRAGKWYGREQLNSMLEGVAKRGI
jgi:imidazolonepropionase-like amidohydrolase